MVKQIWLVECSTWIVIVYLWLHCVFVAATFFLYLSLDVFKSENEILLMVIFKIYIFFSFVQQLPIICFLFSIRLSFHSRYY